MKILSIKKSADFQQKNHSSLKFHTHSFTLVANPTDSFILAIIKKKEQKFSVVLAW